MKEFQSFVDGLSPDALCELDDIAMSYANSMLEKHKEEINNVMMPIMHERYYSYKKTLCLLERYHEWVSE